MDLRDNINTQVKDHIATLRVLAKQATPPLVVWEEMVRILEESAMHLELHVLPKIEAKQPYLDLRTGKLGGSPNIAEFVGSTSKEASEEPLGTPEKPFLALPRTNLHER